MLQRDAHCADLPMAVSGAPRSAILVPLYRSTARGYQGDGLSRARGDKNLFRAREASAPRVREGIKTQAGSVGPLPTTSLTGW